MDADLKIKMYKDMLRIRTFEEKVRVLDMAGKLPGFFHLYVGEEDVAVGACSAINADDYNLFYNYYSPRQHVHEVGAQATIVLTEPA